MAYFDTSTYPPLVTPGCVETVAKFGMLGGLQHATVDWGQFSIKLQ